jgi:hypothetical protein
MITTRIPDFVTINAEKGFTHLEWVFGGQPGSLARKRISYFVDKSGAYAWKTYYNPLGGVELEEYRGNDVYKVLVELLNE